MAVDTTEYDITFRAPVLPRLLPNTANKTLIV
jgi:hypothetical protein